MYSWEIHAILEKYNYVIPLDVYYNICESPQVQIIKFVSLGDYYELSTTDGYYCKFTIDKEKKEYED